MNNSIKLISHNHSLRDILETHLLYKLFKTRYLHHIFNFSSNLKTIFVKRKIEVKIYLRIIPNFDYELFKIIDIFLTVPFEATQIVMLVRIDEKNFSFKYRMHTKNSEESRDVIIYEQSFNFFLIYPASYFDNISTFTSVSE